VTATEPCDRCGANSWVSDRDGRRCLLCNRPPLPREHEEPTRDASDFRRGLYAQKET